MHVEEKLFVRDGLKPGDIVACDIFVGLVTVIRPPDPNYPARGHMTLRWGTGQGSDKRYISSISDRSRCMDFILTLAETHGCQPRLVYDTETKLACELVRLPE